MEVACGNKTAQTFIFREGRETKEIKERETDRDDEGVCGANFTTSQLFPSNYNFVKNIKVLYSIIFFSLNTIDYITL